MHICPQELMLLAGAFDIMRPALLIAKAWCEACVTGVHKNCEDHAKSIQQDEKLNEQPES